MLDSSEKPEEAEGFLRISLEFGRKQHSFSWQLRQQRCLDGCYNGGQSDEARILVARYFNQYQEGFRTADVAASSEFLRATT